MVPPSMLREETETTKSASVRSVEGDELSAGNVLANDLADRAVYMEKLCAASTYLEQQPVPKVEEMGLELSHFIQAYENSSLAVVETEHDFDIVFCSNASEDGVPVAQKPAEPLQRASWVADARGTSTIFDLTAGGFPNPSEPVFCLNPVNESYNRLWPPAVNSPSPVVDWRPKKKRRLSKFARDARRRRMKRRAYRLANGEIESGCEADTESAANHSEEGEDDEDNEPGLSSVGLVYLALR